MEPHSAKSHWTMGHTGVLAVSLALIAALGLLAPPAWSRAVVWLGILALMTASAAAIGSGITGMADGLLIDERNRLSLSRFQMMLWTLIVLSTFVTAVLTNIAASNPAPADIRVPDELWLLMGVSTTSLVGSPLVRSVVAGRPGNTGEAGRAIRTLAAQRSRGARGRAIGEADIYTRGPVVYFTRRDLSRAADLFKGEEVGNADSVDLGKVQMFYFTLAMAATYAVSIGAAFAGSGGEMARDFAFSFPAINANLVLMLGVSHGGYLANKAVPHTAPEDAAGLPEPPAPPTDPQADARHPDDDLPPGQARRPARQ